MGPNYWNGRIFKKRAVNEHAGVIVRWFKHMANSSSDEKLCSVLDALGLEGYGFYWRVLETIAQQMGKSSKTFCEYSPKIWGNFTGISAKKFENFIRIFENNSLFLVVFSKYSIKVDCPNLLKYKDEYSMRTTDNKDLCRDKLPIVSGQTPEEKQKQKQKQNTKADLKDTPLPPKGQKQDFILPEWVEDKTWKEFHDHRKALKVPITTGAAKGIIRELEKLRDKGYDANEMLRYAMMKGWRTVYEPKNSDNGNRSRAKDTSYIDEWKKELEEVDAARRLQTPGS